MLGSPADYTIIVLAVLIAVGVWTLLERVAQLQREIEDLRRKLGQDDVRS